MQVLQFINWQLGSEISLCRFYLLMMLLEGSFGVHTPETHLLWFSQSPRKGKLHSQFPCGSYTIQMDDLPQTPSIFHLRVSPLLKLWCLWSPKRPEVQIKWSNMCKMPHAALHKELIKKTVSSFFPSESCHKRFFPPPRAAQENCKLKQHDWGSDSWSFLHPPCTELQGISSFQKEMYRKYAD